MSEQQGVAVKTGTNQAVPIAYYSQYSAGAAVFASSAQASTADDYLSQAKELLGKKGSEQEVVRLANQALATRQSAEAYHYRGNAKSDIGDKQGAIADHSQAIAINPRDADLYYNRGNAKSDLGDNQEAIADYNQALSINPRHAIAYLNRGNAKHDLGDKQGAIADYNQALSINPQYADAYRNRGISYEDTGDLDRACRDWRVAASLGASNAAGWVRKQCQ